jgi:hypothetical protein
MILSEVDESVAQDLIKIPFSRRTLTEKLKIIKDGRPRPPLANLKWVHSAKKYTSLGILGIRVW